MRRIHPTVRKFILYLNILIYFYGPRVESCWSSLDKDDSPILHPQDDEEHSGCRNPDTDTLDPDSGRLVPIEASGDSHAGSSTTQIRDTCRYYPRLSHVTHAVDLTKGTHQTSSEQQPNPRTNPSTPPNIGTDDTFEGSTRLGHATPAFGGDTHPPQGVVDLPQGVEYSPQGSMDPSAPSQSLTMAPHDALLGRIVGYDVALRNRLTNDFLMNNRPGRLQNRAPWRAKKTLKQVIEQLTHQPQFWHFVIDILKSNNFHGIVQKVDNDEYKFHVGNPELLSVAWSVVFGRFKTFSDLTDQLEQLQGRDILEKKSNSDRHYTFNKGNSDVKNYVENHIPSTSLERPIIHQISDLQVPLISDEYRLFKNDEAHILCKLMIYIMRQPAFKLIIYLIKQESNTWTFCINDTGRLAIAWSLVLKSRRTPGYLIDIICEAKCDPNMGASIAEMEINPSDERVSELIETQIEAFGYSPKFLQQLSLLCRRPHIGLSTLHVDHRSSALSKELAELFPEGD